MSLRQKRKEELKEEIFRQSLRLFKEKGYDNVTVDEITRECGIAKGTFYNYFPKKEYVLLHLGLSQMDVFSASLEKCHPDTDIKEKIEKIFSSLFVAFEKEWELMSLAVSEILRTNLVSGQELETIDHFTRSLAAMLAEAKEQGQLSAALNPQTAASTLISIYFHTLMVAISSNDSTRLSAIFREHFDVIWNGLKP